MHADMTNPWLFPSTEIYQKSPSRVDGISWALEKELRRRGCLFIHEVVTKMRKPGHPAASDAVTESAACIFFHRFFTYESFHKHHRWIIAATCVFLAFKVEEHPRHIDAVIKAYCQMRSSETEEDYKKSRDHILTAERIVLNVLCFDLRLDHPISPCMMKFNGDLKPLIPQAREIRVDVVNKALNFLRDSAGTILCVVYPAHTIAMGAIFLAVLELNCLPLDSSNRVSNDRMQPPSFVNIAQAWFEIIQNDIRLEDLIDVCNQMIEVYEESSDRDRKKSSSRQVMIAPDVSSMRRGINSLSQPTTVTSHPQHRRRDQEEVNLGDVCSRACDEPLPNHPHRQSPASTKKTGPMLSSSEKPVFTVVPPAPPTPDFQPPQTPDFQPPQTPDFQPPPTPQSRHSSPRMNESSKVSQSHQLPPSTPDFHPPPTPEFQPPQTPEFLPPSTPESFSMMPPPSSSSASKPHSRNSDSLQTFPIANTAVAATADHGPTKRARLQ